MFRKRTTGSIITRASRNVEALYLIEFNQALVIVRIV